MIDQTNAAKQAVNEAEKRVEGSLPASDVGRAEQYIADAIAEMQAESGGYDPNVYATPHGKNAAIEYAKARLLGQQPENASSYIQAKKQWGKIAAAEYHKQGHNID
jgi:hypothetical protein